MDQVGTMLFLLTHAVGFALSLCNTLCCFQDHKQSVLTHFYWVTFQCPR